jgi:class III poly(R)-hydroxyalkanoic acid synthase PhaE subunit
MTWNNQAESMMNMWTEAQKTLWQGWYDAVQAASTPAMFNPGMLEEWRKMASQGVESWMGGADSTFGNVSRQFVASQAAMMQLLKFTTDAWQAMAPRLDAGQDWNTVMSNYAEQMRQQLFPNARGMAQTAQDATQTWNMYLQYMQNMAQPWMNVGQQAPGILGSMTPGSSGSKEMIELTKLTWDAYTQTLGRYTMSPAFGLTRELEEKISRAFAAWQEMQQASNDYQVLMADAWSGVFQQVLQEMKDRAEQGKPIESVRELMRLWLSAADQSFDRIFRTESYAEVQGRFVTNTMKYRIEEQKVVEEMMKATYVPTRSEMDEAHRNIYELRKEVKALKKALNQKPGSSSSSSSSASSSRSRSRSKTAETSQDES